MSEEMQELLDWLRERRDIARQAASDQSDDFQAGLMVERTDTYSEVIQHVQFG